MGSKPTLPAAELRVETLPVAGGAELVTLIRRVPGGPELPVLSVVRDTLGDVDPRNDRLSEVYFHTYAAPSIWQKAFSTVPFFYWRGGPGKSDNPQRRPKALLDLNNADGPAWEGVVWAGFQRLVLDGFGTPVRATTRSYAGNKSDLRNTQMFRAAGVVNRMDDEDTPGLSDGEQEQLLARLLLATSATGGWVSDSSLNRVSVKKQAALAYSRGQNWELLRQRAEAESLYFSPINYAGSDSFGMLWIAKPDLETPPRRAFSNQFLAIADPWNDERLKRWNGYTETWYFDGSGARVPAAGEGIQAREMIPLALYALEHPRVPLRLVDFRDENAPRRREIFKRSTRDLITQFAGWSRFTNWYYFAGHSAWFFVTGRRGGAVDRNSRQSAYSLFRTFLWFDESMDPRLREELRRRESLLNLNPLDTKELSEEMVARRHYDALLAWLGSPDGEKHLNNLRRAELTRYRHSAKTQALYQVLSIASLGMYRHRDSSPHFLEQLDVERKLSQQAAFLDRTLCSTQLLEITADLNAVRQAVEVLGQYPREARRWNGAKLIRRVYGTTFDSDTRNTCLLALGAIDKATGTHEVLALNGPGPAGE